MLELFVVRSGEEREKAIKKKRKKAQKRVAKEGSAPLEVRGGRGVGEGGEVSSRVFSRLARKWS